MNSLKDAIYKLENLLLEPETRKSINQLNELIAEDFLEFGSSGMIFNKKDVLESLPSETDIKFKILDFEVKELSLVTVLATYKLNKTISQETFTSLRSSIWKKTNNNWQMLFHQGTRIDK